MKLDLPPCWSAALAPEIEQPYFKKLAEYVRAERAAHQVFPHEDDVFSAFKLTLFDDVRVLLLGQDPYHDDGQAHGLCFSVRPGVAVPPSLVNMYKEAAEDVAGFTIPKHGCLTAWAKQGVLMLNAVLTVRAHQPNSHKNQGWESFTDAVIRRVSARQSPAVFVLWGGYAQKKEKLIDARRHVVLKSAHPSPLSARSGFFGSKPYSKINAALRDLGQKEIDWRLPEQL